MAALITERNQRTVNSSKDNTNIITTRANRVFDVSGVANATEALAALNASGIDYGAAHPQDPRAVVSDINQSENVTAGMYTYTVSYDSRAGGSAVLLDPPTVKYDPYTYTEIRDRDVNGVPYVNTAGMPFEGGLEVELEGVIVTVARYEQTYSIQRHFAYAGYTNIGTFSLPGGTLSDGQAKCIGIFQGEKSAVSTAVRVEYKFDCRAEGWKKNVIDQGPRGYGTPSGGGTVVSGLFVGGPDGEAVGSVRLDGTGKPLDTLFKVSAPHRPNMPPASPTTTSPSTALLDKKLSTSTVKVLGFSRNKSKAFDLNL